MKTTMSRQPYVGMSAFALFGASLLFAGCGRPTASAPGAGPKTTVAAKTPAELTGGKSTRRDVKTAIDADAAKISTTPTDTTVEDIAAQKAPAGSELGGRVAPFETSTWRVKAKLASVKLMKDGDYYLVMKGGKGGESVVEVPDPKDCQGSPLLPQITAARKQLDDRYHPTTTLKELHDDATVTGVGFMGFGSKKTGKGNEKRGSSSRLMPGLGFSF